MVVWTIDLLTLGLRYGLTKVKIDILPMFDCEITVKYVPFYYRIPYVMQNSIILQNHLSIKLANNLTNSFYL